MFVDDGLIPKQ